MIGEIERDVVRRRLPEVADHQLDQMPVRCVRLHEHGHLWTDLILFELAILGELAVHRDQYDDAERQGGPRCAMASQLPDPRPVESSQR